MPKAKTDLGPWLVPKTGLGLWLVPKTASMAGQGGQRPPKQCPSSVYKESSHLLSPEPMPSRACKERGFVLKVPMHYYQLYLH